MPAIEPRPAWRCTSCSRISNAAANPGTHTRAGEPCGPFEAAQIAPDGAVLVPAGAQIVEAAAQTPEVEPHLRFRQSRLRSFMECARRTVLASDLTTGGIGASADLGSAFHAVAAEYLNTLRRHGETQASTEEIVVICREVLAAGPWVLPSEAYARLIEMVCNLAAETWNPARFMAIEKRLFMDIACPDGEVRTLTGTPDLVIADPGHTPGAICVDHKTGLSKPPTPREPIPEGEAIRGPQYLSDGGFAQLSIYGCLIMHEWPRVQQVTLREKSWRWPGPPREHSIGRADLEHIVPHLGLLMMQLDQGLREGEGSRFAEPRAGRQCATRCSVARTCPIPAEQRGLGVLSSPEAADDEAARWEVVRALEGQMRKTLKAYHEESEYAPRLPDGRVVRWKDKPDGRGRTFGACEPAVIDAQAVAASDDAFVAAMEAELERRTSEAA